MKETAVAWISRIHLLVVRRSGHGFTKQHEALYPDIQSEKGRSQEKGQMANTDTPTRGKQRGSHLAAAAYHLLNIENVPGVCLTLFM